MRILIVFFCLLGFTATVSAAPLSRADKQGLMDSCRPSCTSNKQQSSNMDFNKAAGWCQCSCLQMTELVTKEEMKSGQIEKYKYEIAEKSCNEKLHITPNATPLSKLDRKKFMKGFQPSCTNNMRQTSAMTSNQTQKWCGCIGAEYLRYLTKEELRTGQIVSSKLNNANQVCERKLLTTSGRFR